ncbi:MAG: hypothetical protein RH949_22630 [Coleofasciculus sp. A1-SPW-01]|uniref:hypothetical protein n=1 Tax=Coleofasciculus sp. A1-SPW-01 TaxID=3070819 RepID=UPI0032F5F4B3
MSVYDNSILAFIKVIETNANLLTPPDWDNLNQLANQLPDDDIENISDQLENWLKESASRQEIFQRYQEQREGLTEAEIRDFPEIGVGGSKSPTPANQPSPAAKDMIINSIIRHSPPSTPQTNPANPQGSN